MTETRILTADLEAEMLKSAPLPVKIETTVRDAFEYRFGGQTLPYEITRQLIWLEQKLVKNLVENLGSPDDITFYKAALAGHA